MDIPLRSLTIDHLGNYTSRHLPHIDIPGCPTFPTFRLAGSLPTAVLQNLVRESEQLAHQLGHSPEARAHVHKRMIAKADKYLDVSATRGTGPLHLKNAGAASIVIKHLVWGVENKRYLLHRYCVMPNHVHVIIETLPIGHVLSQYQLTWEAALERKGEADALRDRHECLSYFKLSIIMKGLKGVSAREINALLERKGSLWQQESFDHCIRNPAEYERICNYITMNPVAAGLTSSSEGWPFSG